MPGPKKPKGSPAREQQRKQKTAKNNSKKQKKKRRGIGKEEPRVQTKPWEEEGKKGLEEYKNDVREENHSQGTIEHGMPSEQKKRVSSCASRPLLEEGDCKAKGNEPEEETDHLKAKHKTLEEKDPTSSWTQQSTPCLQKIPCEGRPLEKEEDKEVKDKKLEETKEQCITTMEPGGETMESGDLSLMKFNLSSPNLLLKNKRADLKEILPDVVEAKDQMAECEEGLEQHYAIKGSDVVIRQKFSDFGETSKGKAINKALMTKAKDIYPELKKSLPKTKKFSVAVTCCVRLNNEAGEKMLELLRKISKRFMPLEEGVLKDLVWNKEWGSDYFVWCKTVAILNVQKFHPIIQGDEAESRIRNMASKGEFVRDGHDLRRFMMPNTITVEK